MLVLKRDVQQSFEISHSSRSVSELRIQLSQFLVGLALILFIILRFIEVFSNVQNGLAIVLHFLVNEAYFEVALRFLNRVLCFLAGIQTFLEKLQGLVVIFIVLAFLGNVSVNSHKMG